MWIDVSSRSALTSQWTPNSSQVGGQKSQSYYIFIFIFNLGVASTSATVKVFGIIVVPIPFYIEPDACSHWGVKCPLAADTPNRMSISLPILSAYPPVAASTRVQLLDQEGKNIFCFEFPVKIEHPSSAVGEKRLWSTDCSLVKQTDPLLVLSPWKSQ